ncbi:MAG: sugar phosphate isomerase/epimerase family protein [Nitrososphaerota archaeon]
MSYEDFIEEAYRLGLDGVELTLYWLPTKDDSYLKRLKRHMLFRGLPVSCLGISTNFCIPEAYERERVTKNLEEWLDIAHKLGSPCLRVFGGNIPHGHSETEATEWVIDCLKRCVGYAEDKGIVLALENHGGVTSKAGNVVKIVKGVGSPWLGVNLDLGNYRESTYEQIAKTVPYAVHIHAKRSVAGGGELDYHRIREMLEAGGYNGFLSIEYEEDEDPKTGVPKFANYLLNLFR